MTVMKEAKCGPETFVSSRSGVGDPTANVKALSEAANKRQDDLREASERFISAKIEASAEIDAIRASHAKYMAAAESRRVDEQAALRADFANQLSHAESDRINAIRVVDVNAVSVASQRAADQASVLATQVSQSAEALRTQVAQSAETLRSLVASTASTAATTLQQLVSGLSTRITTLEQAGYTREGKASYTDPALTELLREMKSGREESRQAVGKTEGISASVGMMISVGGVIAVLIGALGYTISTRSPTAPLQPQVIYAPAPTVAQPAPVAR